jgi:hypothetical protein
LGRLLDLHVLLFVRVGFVTLHSNNIKRVVNRDGDCAAL